MANKDITIPTRERNSDLHSVTSKPRVAVIIPCYHVASYIQEVLVTIPNFVQEIYVVDDACPQESWKIAQEISVTNKRIKLIRHQINQGVGGAVISGYKAAVQSDCDIFVKIDGDGQMDPRYMHELIQPLIADQADYTKGNRFRDFKALSQMPTIRLLGNSVLSFLVKASSGYWNIMDPTNGYTAIHRRALEKLELEHLSKRYFFESNMLIELNLISATVVDVPMKASYADEHSSLQIRRVITQFPVKLIKGLFRRIFLKYFVYDFNMASIYLALGIPLVLFGTIFGIFEWVDSFVSNHPKSAGTIMVAALPIILGFQMLLQAIQIDIDKTPKPRN